QADPGAGVYRTLTGAGSDTTEDVVNGLGNALDNGTLIASYDATGSSTIKTRSNGCEIARPNGSSAGITALVGDIAAGTDCLDFARSSRPAATTGTNLTFIPFATDKLKMAVRSDSALRGVDFTKADLKAIYECTKTDVNGVPVTPVLPQSGSGTRSFFLSSIGDPALGSCVGSMQEHRGTDLTSTAQIAPYSVAKYTSQVNELIPDVHGATVLTTIDSGEVVRDVYNVVETARLGEAAIASTFVGPDSKVCKATSTITRYGFGTAANCGDVAMKGNS
ncbi:substrate-binding domain-containing protein, partial [Streptomyces sp. TRM76130]|nr:substrate-binding domain-containing protein [Streptomyces sp. TRM76130]